MKCEDYFVSYTLHLMRPLSSPRVMQMKPPARDGGWTVADGGFLADLKEVISHVMLDANCVPREL